MTELKASLETIQATAKELITEIEGHFTELQQQRQAEQEQEAKTKETLLLNGKEDSYGIYQLAAERKLWICALSLSTVCKQRGISLTGQIMNSSIPHRLQRI